MSPKILGKPGVESLLEKTVLSTNAGLGEESQLPPELGCFTIALLKKLFWVTGAPQRK